MLGQHSVVRSAEPAIEERLGRGDATIRVLLAERNGLLNEGIAALIGNMTDCALVGTASDGPLALSLAVSLAPHVILLGESLPGFMGVRAIEQLRREAPAAAVVVLADDLDDEAVWRALRAGVKGYLAHDATGPELSLAIRAAAQGDTLLGHRVAARFRRYLTAFVAPRQQFPDLTDRECEVLDLLGCGMSNLEIARRLQIRDKTVRNHVSNVLSKLGAEDRHEAGRRARAAGMGSDPSHR